MSKKLRYIILGLCFLIFFVLAPLLVLFVRGVTYENNESRLNATGILAVETQPDDAEVFLNGERTTTTPASIRFLKPGDYTVTLRKENYFDWEKKLTVLEGKVTWVNPNPTELTLLKHETDPETITTGASTFNAIGNDRLAYTTEKSLVILSGDKFTETKTIPLAEALPNLQPSPSGAWLILGGIETTYAVNTRSLELTNITALVPAQSQTHFISDSEILALSNGRLERIHLETKAKQLLFSEVKNFAAADDQIYILQKNNTALSLIGALLNAPHNTQAILTDIPEFANAQIFVSLGREALLFGDGVLYRIGNTLEEVVGNVQTIYFDQARSNLVLTVPGELDYYSFEENKIKLISRSNEQFSNIMLRRDLGYAFAIHQGKLEAIELDNRDRQNTYNLIDLKNPKNFVFLDDKRIALLDDGRIKLLTVR